MLDDGKVTDMKITKNGKQSDAKMLHVKIGDKDGYVANDLIKMDAPADKANAPGAAPANAPVNAPPAKKPAQGAPRQKAAPADMH